MSPPDERPRFPLPPDGAAAELHARSLARGRRAAMRARRRRIRGWVAALAAVVFLAAFAIVYVQLASGHDPALTASAKRSARTAVASHAKAASTSPSEAEKHAAEKAATEVESSSASSSSESAEAPSSSTGSGASGSSESGGSSSSSRETPASAVTTRQS